MARNRKEAGDKNRQQGDRGKTDLGQENKMGQQGQFQREDDLTRQSQQENLGARQSDMGGEIGSQEHRGARPDVGKSGGSRGQKDQDIAGERDEGYDSGRQA